MQYLMWRVLSGRHNEITISFLVVGHTKFAPDWCFGLLKRLYRRSRVGSIRSIAEVVDNSADCNFSQRVSAEDGSVIVTTYDWTDFFSTKLRKIIKKYCHFHFSHTRPGIVFVKEHSDTTEHEINLLKHPWAPNSADLPSIVLPKSLSLERQWYLYNQIRPYCPDLERDLACPLPSVPLPSSRPCSPLLPPLSTIATNSTEVCDAEVCPPPQKKQRICSLCKEVGHNKRTCTKQ